MSHGAEVEKPTNDGRCQSCGNDRVDMKTESECWRCGSIRIDYKEAVEPAPLEFVLEEEQQPSQPTTTTFQLFDPRNVFQVDLTKLKHTDSAGNPLTYQVDLTKLKPSTAQGATYKELLDALRGTESLTKPGLAPHCIHRNKRQSQIFYGYVCTDCGDQLLPEKTDE